MFKRFDVKNIAKFKCIPNSRYIEDGVYVGLTDRAHFEEDLKPGELSQVVDPEKLWPNFANLV